METRPSGLEVVLEEAEEFLVAVSAGRRLSHGGSDLGVAFGVDLGAAAASEVGVDDAVASETRPDGAATSEVWPDEAAVSEVLPDGVLVLLRGSAAEVF